MEPLFEKINMEGKRKEILGNAVELLERLELITKEEKECMMHIILREDGN